MVRRELLGAGAGLLCRERFELEDDGVVLSRDRCLLQLQRALPCGDDGLVRRRGAGARARPSFVLHLDSERRGALLVNPRARLCRETRIELDRGGALCVDPLGEVLLTRDELRRGAANQTPLRGDVVWGLGQRWSGWCKGERGRALCNPRERAGEEHIPAAKGNDVNPQRIERAVIVTIVC